jgi:hypothetical protein
MIVWPCIVTDSLWIKSTDAVNSNFIDITTLHVSGSLSAHHQTFLAVYRLWYILCSCDDRLLSGAGWDANIKISSWERSIYGYKITEFRRQRDQYENLQNSTVSGPKKCAKQENLVVYCHHLTISAIACAGMRFNTLGGLRSGQIRRQWGGSGQINNISSHWEPSAFDHTKEYV